MSPTDTADGQQRAAQALRELAQHIEDGTTPPARLMAETLELVTAIAAALTPKRGRGRPPGSATKGSLSELGAGPALTYAAARRLPAPGTNRRRASEVKALLLVRQAHGLKGRKARSDSAIHAVIALYRSEADMVLNELHNSISLTEAQNAGSAVVIHDAAVRLPDAVVRAAYLARDAGQRATRAALVAAESPSAENNKLARDATAEAAAAIAAATALVTQFSERKE